MNAVQAKKDTEGLPDDSQKVDKAERGRSRIEWPYFSLDEAYRLAKGVFDLGGTCQIDQLAGSLNQAAAGGAFRLKVQAARTFGLLTSSQGNISLTELGSEIVDPETEREARAIAFLKVPLYAALYENFKGKTLPGPTGLEGAMVNLGVAVKQRDKARQAFQRSAKESGFFAYGSTKLVYPVFGQDRTLKESKNGPSDTLASDAAEVSVGGKTGTNGTAGSSLHPFIQGLLTTLPKPESNWPLEGRRRWLQSALSIFDLIYEGTDDSQSLAITINKSSAK